MDELDAVSITQPLFEKFSAGNACAAEMEITFSPRGEVPRMAKIIPYARDDGETAWTQLGVFYTDERSVNGNIMTITAYDAMLKSEIEWIPENTLTFPMPMKTAVGVFCELMGVELDSRTGLRTEARYAIDYPANEYTIRDILRYIAGAHGGNWIITAEGKLLLVPLFGGMDDTDSYLVNENGQAITIGGARIRI